MKFPSRLLPSSLTNRVFALYAITLLMFMGAGLVLFLKYQFHQHVEEAELSAVMLIEVVAQSVQESAVIGDFDSIQKILNKGVQGSQFSSAMFIDTSGGVVRAENAAHTSLDAPVWLVQWVRKSLDDVNRSVSVGGRDYGILRLQFDSPFVAAGLWYLTLIVMGGGLASLVVGLVFIRVALARWLGGLVLLRETVEALGTGAATNALVIEDAPVEIQSLVDMVNQTAALVREREATRRALDQQKFALDQHAIVSVADIEGTILYANDRLCDITGYSRAELLGRKLSEFRSDLHPQSYFDQSMQNLAEGKVWRGEICSRKRNGDLYWVDATMVPMLGEDGHSRQYITIRTDITARKQAEQERAAANEILFDRSLQLQVTLDNISQGVMMIAADSGVVFQSHRVLELLEIPQELHSAGHAALVAFQTERGDFGVDFDLVDEFARPYLRGGGKPGAPPPPPVYTRRTLSGRTLEIKSTVLPAGGFVRTFTDVTGYVQALANAQQASVAKGQFLANMSHEIRTPMNAILGLLHLLQDTPLNATQVDFVDKIHGAARSLLGLINDILDFSKVEAGKMTLDPRPFDLDKMLKDLSVILATTVGTKPVVLRFDVEPDVPRVLLGDDMRLLQVLINLGGNAIKFTSQGAVVLRVRQAERSATDAVLEFAMSDSGIGIASENQARIFSGFSQAEASTTRSYGGTGLGLSISSRLVALLGGELQLTSALGQGSTFYFQIRFPLASLPAAGLAAPVVQGEAAVERVKRLQGIRVLVVEDNKINQMVARGLLSKEGADITLADNGQLGVAAVAAAKPPFDVVLMDMQMPVMDGYAATSVLRQEMGLTTLPIIAMTANALVSDRAACLEAGMDEHIGKPFDLDHLVATMLRLTGRRSD
ncbi:MAG: response regulator [Rhodoferax sp.]|nr:response regulator [Rhodoferax sp.]